MSVINFKETRPVRRKEQSMVRFLNIPNERQPPPKISHVYLPRLHRQKTEIVPATRSAECMQELVDVFLTDDKIDEEMARSESVQLINRLVLNLRKTSGLDFKTAYQVENYPQFTKDPETLYFVLPFKFEGVNINPLDSGYVTIKPLKRVADIYHKYIAYDGVHLSALKFERFLSDLLIKAAKKMDSNTRNAKKRATEQREDQRKDRKKSSVQYSVDDVANSVSDNNGAVHYETVEEEDEEDRGSEEAVDGPQASSNKNPADLDEGQCDSKESVIDGEENEKILPENTHAHSDSEDKTIQTEVCLQSLDFRETEIEPPFTVRLMCGWKLELLPAIFTSIKDPVIVTKPYEMDENEHSDIRWRFCYAKRESMLLKTISDTDKDFRIAAVNIVLACMTCESRLTLFSPYQIQTCLLHDMDFLLDNSPRWQRQTLDRCVKSLIKRLYDFVVSRNLPHFFIENFNLLEYWSESELKMAKSALERLFFNESALINLIKRTTRKKLNATSDNMPESMSRTSTHLSTQSLK